MAAVVVLGAVASGCSWMAMGPVPERPRHGGTVDCEASQAAPVADTVGAVLFAFPVVPLVGVGAVIASGPGCSPDTGDMCIDPRGFGYLVIGAGVLSLGIVTLYALSARHGFRHAERCAELRRPVLDWLPEPSRLPKEPPP
jgi:hypothetical protein